MDDLTDFTADQLLKYAYPELRKVNRGDLPVYRYLYQAQEDYPQIRGEIKHSFDDLTTATNKRNRKSTDIYSSLQELWESLKDNPPKAYRVMCWLPEEKMDADYLGRILQNLFTKDSDALNRFNGETRSNLKRLIRIYDYLKWGKK